MSRTKNVQPALSASLALYETEIRLYGEVLALSRQQGDLLRSGASLAEIRCLLESKRARLDEISRLEQENASSSASCEAQRHALRGATAAALHQALREVGNLIEQILELEEANDRLLFAKTGA